MTKDVRRILTARADSWEETRRWVWFFFAESGRVLINPGCI